MKRDFKGIWIPKQIWLSTELTMQEKLFLVEIDSLDNEDGCFASNAYFSEFFGVTKGRCTQIIKKLETKQIITIKLEYNGKSIKRRIIKVVNKLTRGSEKTKQGYLENDEDNNTLYISTTTTENEKINIATKIKTNQYLVETLQMQLKNVDVIAKIDEFESYCISVNKTHQNDSDIYQHFMAWIRQNKFNRNRNIDKELEYFIKIFNKISRKTWQPTQKIRELLIKRLDDGFTSEQMITAIKNMRSSNDLNWHKKTKYVHATPQHLLKDENLNKYLNQRY